jgi:hypothetical protein
VDIDVTNQLLITVLHSLDTGKNRSTIGGCIAIYKQVCVNILSPEFRTKF